MVAHNASFDISFIKENARRQGLTFQPTVLDTVSLARASAAEPEPLQARHGSERALKFPSKTITGRCDDAGAYGRDFCQVY